MTKRRRHNASGRTEGEPRFVQIPYWVLETAAALSLSPPAFKVLIYLLKRFNGVNNGKIGFGSRSGCFLRPPGAHGLEDRPIGIAPRTISDALYELERAGFLRCVKDSTFDQKRATKEWRVTWLAAGGEAPTKEFVATAGSCRRLKASKKQKPERARALSPQLQSGYAPHPTPQKDENDHYRAATRPMTEFHRAATRPHLVTIPIASDDQALSVARARSEQRGHAAWAARTTKLKLSSFPTQDNAQTSQPPLSGVLSNG